MRAARNLEATQPPTEVPPNGPATTLALVTRPLGAKVTWTLPLPLGPLALPQPAALAAAAANAALAAPTSKAPPPLGAAGLVVAGVEELDELELEPLGAVLPAGAAAAVASAGLSSGFLAAPSSAFFLAASASATLPASSAAFFLAASSSAFDCSRAAFVFSSSAAMRAASGSTASSLPPMTKNSTPPMTTAAPMMARTIGMELFFSTAAAIIGRTEACLTTGAGGGSFAGAVSKSVLVARRPP